MRKRTERQLKKLGVDLEALRAPPTPGRDATVFGLGSVGVVCVCVCVC